jgi:hypothetical protein
MPTCMIDGMSAPCSSAFGLVQSGAGTVKGGPGFYGDVAVVNHEPTFEGARLWQSLHFFFDPQNTEQQQRMTDARTDFKKRLEANKGDNPCAKLFGGLKNAEKALNKGANIFVGPAVDPNIGATTTGKNVAINPVGGFFDTSGSRTFQLDFNLRDKTAKYVVLGNVEAAAFILAHELGHVTGKLENDGGDPFGFKSIWNNKKVHDACFSEVPSFTGPQR